MSEPRSAMRDVANKILSVVNQIEQNATTQPPNQASSLMQTQPTKQISSPMQISQIPRPVSQIQTQTSQTSRSTSSRTVSKFNRLFHPYRTNSPSSGNSSKGRRKSTQMPQVTFTVFCLGRKDTKNVPGTEEKAELFLAGLGRKKGNIFIYRLECRVCRNYLGGLPHVERYQIRCFSRRKKCQGDGVYSTTSYWIQHNIY